MGWFFGTKPKTGTSGNAAGGGYQARGGSAPGGAPSADRMAGRSFTIRLSLSGLITAGIIALIGLGWIFAFGVIIGRGYDPAQKIPELARLMPAQPAGNATEGAENAAILKPEELTFMQDLKQRPGVEGDVLASRPAPAPGAASPAGAAAPKGAAPASPTTAASAAPASAPPGTGAGRSGQSTPAPTSTVYDIVFQVVAYKNSSQADSLRERLEQDGLRTRMTIEKDAAGKARWYRVQVLSKGTDEEAAAVKARLAKLGLKDATVASKKPATRNR